MNVNEKLLRKDRKLLFSFLVSIVVSLVLTIYNAVFGLVNHVIFNACGAIYYLILLIIRTIIFIEEYRWMKKGIKMKKSTYLFNSVLMIIISVSLVGVACWMIYRQNPVKLSNVPIIILAVFAGYKIFSVVKRLIEYRKEKNAYTRQVLNVTLISAVVTLLTFQNTFIVVCGGFSKRMVIFSILSSVFAVVLLEAVSILFCYIGVKEFNKEKQSAENK